MCRKSVAFFGWPKIKDAEFFAKSLYISNTKKKKCFLHKVPEGANWGELGKGGRKLEGSKIKGADN